MAADHPIPPFPADIDRVAFGHWLSGFTDGEASFYLYAGVYPRSAKEEGWRAVARFTLGVRSDDGPILESIRSYWQCGTIYLRRPRSSSKPLATYIVHGASQLESVVVPHFEAFPLRAKKRGDFAIWKQGVILLARINRRRWRREKGVGHGRSAKWTREEVREFDELSRSLRANRAFDGPTTIIRERTGMIDEHLPLFDRYTLPNK